jgi:hypothetical protein
VSSERRDFDRLRPELHVRETKTPADDPAVAKQLLDLVRVRRRPDVEVFRPSSEQQVAHAAADEIGDVIALTQSVEDLQRIGVNIAPRERVLLAWNDPRFDHWAALYQTPPEPFWLARNAQAVVLSANRRHSPRPVATATRDGSSATIAGMYRVAAALIAFVAWTTVAIAADSRDPLDRARALYNQHQFGAAIDAADEARRVPQLTDGADLIAARAYLERFRESSAPEDLVHARERLRAISPEKFSPRERIDFIVGLGETLYFEGSSGAAAAVFESVLVSNRDLADQARERVLDWWASALDQDARPRPEIERQTVYQRVRDRMALELAVNPTSASAPYWAAAAARGQGDLQAAWDAAQAAWVRAPLTRDRGEALRHDLDVLVQKAIVPERSRIIGRPPESLMAEWEAFKAMWTGAR